MGTALLCNHAVVDRQRALEVLQLGPSATVEEAHAAYRRLVRSSHPDLIGTEGTEAMILLNQAMATLEAVPVVDGADDPLAGAGGSGSSVSTIEDDVTVLPDALTLNAPADELFARLAEALDVVGDLTYADASSGYLEAAVSMGNPSPSQLVVSLQGRGEDTEAFFTLEAMGVETPPDLETVVAAIGAVLARNSAARQ